MLRTLEAAVIGAAAIAWASTAVAQPPPPPPPGFPDYVGLLDDAFNRQDLAAYGKLFADDVHIFVDGALVASDRAAYLAGVQQEFARNLHHATLSWAQGSQILAMQAVRGCVPREPDPRVFYHGCHWSRAVRYDLADDGRIASVHILEAEHAWNVHPAQ